MIMVSAYNAVIWGPPTGFVFVTNVNNISFYLNFFFDLLSKTTSLKLCHNNANNADTVGYSNVN